MFAPNYYGLPSAAAFNYEVGYNAGVLEAVVEGNQNTIIQCPENLGTDFNDFTRTFLRFKTSDGTEYSLYNVLHDGQVMPNPNPCALVQNAALRGKVFVTKDGSGMTFISDADIYDNQFDSGPYARYFPSGVLMLRDGTRYRIDNGVVTSLSVRNGNKISYENFAPILGYGNLALTKRFGRIAS